MYARTYSINCEWKRYILGYPMEELISIQYIVSSGVLAGTSACMAIYHIFTSYFAPITFEILLVPCYVSVDTSDKFWRYLIFMLLAQICGVVCAFLYYREIKYD